MVVLYAVKIKIFWCVYLDIHPQLFPTVDQSFRTPFSTNYRF